MQANQEHILGYDQNAAFTVVVHVMCYRKIKCLQGIKEGVGIEVRYRKGESCLEYEIHQ